MSRHDPLGERWSVIVIEIGSRTRGQAPPPTFVFAALAEPAASTGRREWLFLEDDEVVPQVLEQSGARRVLWSSLWERRPDLRIEFLLAPAGGGTTLTWTLWADEPVPDTSFTGHARMRLNQLINRDLRAGFGQ